MADSIEDIPNSLENVRLMVRGNQFSVSQLGIDLIQQAGDENDPIIEAVVVSRRMSGLIETEMCVSSGNRDTMSKFAEHLTIRSNFESAAANAMVAYEDDDD